VVAPTSGNERFVELLGWIPLAVVACLILAVGAAKLLGRFSDSLWFSKGLELEFPRSVTHLERLVGDRGDPRRAKAQRGLEVDYLFIATYWTVLVAFSVLLARRSPDWCLWIGCLAGAAATLTAAFDLRENRCTERVLDAPLSETTAQMLSDIRSAALAKWISLTIAVAALSSLFWGDRPSAVHAFGIAYLACAALGVVALGFRPALQLFFPAVVLAVLATVVLFVADRDEFLRGF
jgi:hypothetical protein